MLYCTSIVEMYNIHYLNSLLAVHDYYGTRSTPSAHIGSPGHSVLALNHHDIDRHHA
jgi:hypothetical protein